MSSTTTLYLFSRVLCCPLEIFFTLLVFILGKDLGALPIQLTIITCFKPISSLFAYYNSSFIFNKPQRIRYYLIGNYLVGSLPCLLYPFVENVWFYVASYAIFIVSIRSTFPAWMELLKSCMDKKSLSKIVSKGTSIFYALSLLLPPILGYCMDHSANVWRLLFVLFAALQILNMLIVFLFVAINPQIKWEGKKEHALKQSLSLLKEKPNFTHYLLLYVLGGVGILISQPILPIYFKENLNLSYTALTMAFSFCKGISFVIASPIWAKLSTQISLYRMNLYMNILTTVYFVFLLAANLGTEWLYAGYLFYGTMIAGCEMCWNVSGPFFANKEDSTIFSGLNLFSAGLRGCVAPLTGYLLFTYTNTTTVFVVAGLVTVLCLPYALWLDRRYPVHSNIQVKV